MTLGVGASLGPYRIEASLGSGGMGEVYRARDPRLGRDVAIKVLPAACSADPERLQRFEQEARAAAALNHPNILAVYDVGTDNGSPYVVSELLEGGTLRERLTGPLPVRRAVDYAIQMAHGFAAAHEQGIVHRDLKPENKLMAVVVGGQDSAFEVGTVQPLFDTRSPPTGLRSSYDVSPDGQRFLVNTLAEEAPGPITLVVNWPALLKK